MATAPKPPPPIPRPLPPPLPPQIPLPNNYTAVGNPGGAAPLDPNQQLQNELAGLPGQERDAYAALTTLFNSYGLGTLAPTILGYLQNGYGADTITVLLQQTPEYKQRFAGNQTRIQNGLQVLTPAEYLSTEAAYKDTLRQNGLSTQFGSQDQLNQWIGDDVSPTELQDRVGLAVQATIQAPPSVKQAFNELGVPTSALAGFFLNDNTPTPELQTMLTQAQIKGSALQNGLDLNSQDAYKYAQQGVTYSQAQSAYQKIAEILPTANKLSQIYTSQAPVNQTTLEQQYLGQSGQAQLNVERLGQQETAAFAGQAGTGKTSFQQQTTGAPGF
jgi:hypothetical protein